jgi:uncharacterized protein (TIGR03437 family)
VNSQSQVVSQPIGSGVSITPGSSIAALGTGTYSATITFTASDGATAALTVNLTVNGGSSGGFTITPSTINLAAAVGGTTQQTVSIYNPVAGALTISVSGSGLSYTPTYTSTSVTAGSTVAVNVVGDATSLSANTYSGNLSATLVPTGGSSSYNMNAAINFSVGSGGITNNTVTPTSLNFAYQPGGSNETFRQYITVAGTGTYTATASTTAAQTSQQWLSLGSASGSIPGLITVNVSPSGLATGTYNGSITVSPSNAAQVQIPVVLLVTSSAVLSANPGSLSFNYASGAGNTPTTLQVTGSDNSNQAVTVNTPTWLSVSTLNALTPATYSVQLANPASLANGLYSGNIVVTSSGFVNSPLNIPVAVIVSGNNGSANGLTPSPTSFSFSAQVNNGSTQTASLYVASNSASYFTASANGVNNNITWLSVSPSGSTIPAGSTLTVSVTPGALPVGTYNGQIQLTANNVTSSVPVTLVVSTTGGGGNTGNVSVSPTSLSFTSDAGGDSQTKTLSVASAAGAAGISYTVSAATSSGGSWLSTNIGANVSVGTPSNIIVTANPGSLAAGTYNGTITLTPYGGTVVTVPVSLTIAGPPTITASPTQLNFSYQAGGAAPAAQSVQVTGSTSSLTFSVLATSTGNWLLVSPASGTAPATLSVSIDPTNLNPGTHQGTISLAAGTGTTVSTPTINVTVTVTAPLPVISKITNAASYATGPISPGEIITIFGTAIGPATGTGLALDQNGNVATTSGGVQVLFNGIAAPMVYASSTQVSAVVPYAIAQIASPSVYIRYGNQSSNGLSPGSATTAPGIFSANSSGTGPGAILNQDYSVNAPGNPAAKGSVVSVYMTGEGQTSPGGSTGKVTTAPYPVPLLPVAVLVDGQPATYQFAGEAPGFVSGVMQLNVVIPASARTGDLPLLVKIGSNSSQAGITVSVK